jgi:hypothetical protein
MSLAHHHFRSVTEAEKKCDNIWKREHSVHGAGLGVEGGQVSERPRTHGNGLFLQWQVPWK